MRNVARTTTALAFFVVALVAVGVASAAGGSASNAYKGVAGTVQSALQTTKPSSTLPFTGADLSIFVAVALALGLVGFMMRRVGREQE